MKNIVLTIFISLVFISCGDKHTHTIVGRKPDSYIQNSEFEKHIKAFEDLTGQEVAIPVYFKNIKKHLGTCHYSKLGNFIEIDLRQWYTLDATQQEQLIFHELAHCILDCPHVKDKKSLLYPYLLPSPYYRNNRDLVLSKLLKCE